MSVAVQRGGALIKFGQLSSLFKLTSPAPHLGSLSDYPYDVAQDGRILGFSTSAGAEADGLVVISNWQTDGTVALGYTLR